MATGTVTALQPVEDGFDVLPKLQFHFESDHDLFGLIPPRIYREPSFSTHHLIKFYISVLRQFAAQMENDKLANRLCELRNHLLATVEALELVNDRSSCASDDPIDVLYGHAIDICGEIFVSKFSAVEKGLKDDFLERFERWRS